MNAATRILLPFGTVAAVLVAGGVQAGPPKSKVHVVADFEAADLPETLFPAGMTIARSPDGEKRGKGHVMAGRIEKEGRRSSWLDFVGLPKDISAYRSIQFRIRCPGSVTHPCYVRLRTTTDATLESKKVQIGAVWTPVKLQLPAMRTRGNFNPKDIKYLRFVWFRPPLFEVELDDVRLVEAGGGWRYSKKEAIEHAFGPKRARKVKHLQTKHFDIYSDSAAARKKFPSALEGIYDFVRETLGLEEMQERLPVYLHQNPRLYWDFCVRYTGWSREGAEKTAGHGGGGHFSTYYQSPKAPVVVHELTHSLFHRMVGSRGGSWFQEGVAVYVEELAQKRSIATMFSPLLRKKRHVPLREFITIDRLVDSHDDRGGSREAGNLYDQAGAFFEFLLRGPLLRERNEDGTLKHKALPDKIREIAQRAEEGEELAARLEQLLGKSLEEIEAAWIQWGSKPPKLAK